MPVIYTKGALKKINKDDLIYMFCFQQDNLKKLQGESRSELGTPYKELYEAQYQENKKLQEENKKLQEQVKKLQDEEYDPDNPNHVLVDADTESEEETDKYDGDDWRWVYGKMIVDNEDEDTDEEWKDVVLNIAGGGDHWENWIMRPTMNYIENKDGLHPQHGKVLVQSSCGKYLSFQDKDYVPDDGECICEYEISVEC